MIKYIIIAILFLMPANQLAAQYPNIRVSKPGSTDPEEVTIAINPTNPLNLAAGANIDYYYYSFDGGLTWAEGYLTSTLGVWGDPCVTFDGQGNLFFGHLSNPSFGYWIDRIVVQKSTNGGISWNDGVGIGLNPPKNQDKEWLIADLTNSQFKNNIYMSWTEFDHYGSSSPVDSSRILFARSNDFGETWSDPIKISDVSGDCRDGDNTVEGAVPAIGPDGEIYISWAGPLGIMLDKSTDGGITFGNDIFITAQPGGWGFDVPGIYRCNGLPVTACDISNSPYRGNIYVVWSDQRNGIDNTDIFLIKSIDGGQTWSDIKKVNDDATPRHQFFPWMCIDQFSGYIYIVFYDRRNTTGNTTEAYLAKSTDGGESFENFVVSQSPFTPYSNIFFGDYINVAARKGMVYPIWMRMDGYELSVWTAIISDTATGVNVYRKENFIQDFKLLQNYPNPFNSTTEISFRIIKQSHVNIAVYSIKGEFVRKLIDEEYMPGSYRVRWNGTDRKNVPVATGVYLCCMRTNAGEITKKMILLK